MRLSLSGATARQRLGHLEQGALILAATVATYAVWLAVGLPALPFQVPGLQRLEQEAPIAVNVDDATPPRARATSLAKSHSKATKSSITPTGTHDRARTRPRSSSPTHQGSPPQTTGPHGNPPTAAPRQTPTSSPRDPQPTPTEVRNETPAPPITPPTLPNVPPLPPPLADVPLPQLPPVPVAPVAPALPQLPEPSPPVQTPTVPALPTLP